MVRIKELTLPTLVPITKIGNGNRTAVSLRTTFGDLVDTANHVLVRGTLLPIRNDGRVEITPVLNRTEVTPNQRVRVTLVRT